MIIAYISMYFNNYKTSFYLSITLTIVVHDFYEFIIILDFGKEFIELLKINNNNFKWILLLDDIEQVIEIFSGLISYYTNQNQITENYFMNVLVYFEIFSDKVAFLSLFLLDVSPLDIIFSLQFHIMFMSRAD